MTAHRAETDPSQVAEVDPLQVAVPIDAIMPVVRYANPVRQLAHELPPTLTVPQVADLLHVTEQTIGVWMRKKILPSYQIGGRVLIMRDDVLRSLRLRTEADADDAAASDGESE